MGLFNFFQSNKKEEPQPQPVVKPKVLLAEDEEYILDAYKELLDDAGFEVITATNGQIALHQAIQSLPQVILLDIMMPVMSGLEVLVELKRNEQTKKIPVIILTNAGSIENMETAKYQEVFKFLIKSNIVPDEVVKTAKEAISASTMPQN